MADVTKAPSGMTGLETSLSLGLTYLVEAGHLSLTELLKLMTSNPSDLYGFDAGYLAENGPEQTLLSLQIRKNVRLQQTLSLKQPIHHL